MSLFTMLLAMDFIISKEAGGYISSIIKLVSGLGIISILTTMIFQSNPVEKIHDINKIKETFETKVITYLLGTPDEIAQALVDEKTRAAWDPNVSKIQKITDDTIKMIYSNSQNESLTELLKYTFLIDKEGNYII